MKPILLLTLLLVVGCSQVPTNCNCAQQIAACTGVTHVDGCQRWTTACLDSCRELRRQADDIDRERRAQLYAHDVAMAEVHLRGAALQARLCKRGACLATTTTTLRQDRITSCAERDRDGGCIAWRWE